jgi:hypothetical protein
MLGLLIGHASSSWYESTVKSRVRGLALGVTFLGLACAAPPKPTPAAQQLFRNARAVVEGRVVDRAGRPAAGLGVTAIPRGRDIEWSPAATTDSDGHFVLTLYAPAEYAFVLSRGGRSVITADPDDPCHVLVTVQPGDHRTGLELRFLEGAWNAAGSR